MMNENTQLAQTGTESGTAVSTNCSICRGKKIEKREAINRALGKGISYRDIEAMTGVAYRTIGNHAQHLPAIFREAKEKGILGQSVDVHQEFSEQLRFAKKMRVAAEGYLSHPDTGEICFFPRSDEITVIYEDLQDLTAKGEPKRKSDTLDILLDRIKSGRVEPQRTITKHVDMRSFSLDAIKTADMCVDKFAKLNGDYIKEPTAPIVNIFTDTDFARELFRRLTEKSQWSREDALEGIRQKFPAVDIKLLTGGGEKGE